MNSGRVKRSWENNVGFERSEGLDGGRVLRWGERRSSVLPSRLS